MNFFIIVSCEASFSDFKNVFDPLLGPNLELTVVTASVTAGVLSKNKLATPEEN